MELLLFAFERGSCSSCWDTSWFELLLKLFELLMSFVLTFVVEAEEPEVVGCCNNESKMC